MMKVTQGVEEFQGLYGPYQVSELVLQKIWLKGAFDLGRLRDDRGRKIEVEFPGRWNRLAGPDFKGAILKLDGERVEGDVEIHFSRRDWEAHGHRENPNFDGVVLHVVYYPLEVPSKPTLTFSNEQVPTVSLLELLWYDLEAYASEDSIVESTRSENEAAIETLFEQSLEERRAFLVRRAMERWHLKRHFAEQRIARLGWEESCHSTALEILGYAANRVPMLLVGAAFPLKEIREEAPKFEALVAAGLGRWTTVGTRPANYPERRLRQYLGWVEQVPDWPRKLEELSRELAGIGSYREGTRPFRKITGLKTLRNRFLLDLTASNVTGPRLDTMVCDGFLPLLSARMDVDLSGLWFHWMGGTVPESIRNSLMRLQIFDSHENCLCNGWVQGILKLRS